MPEDTLVRYKKLKLRPSLAMNYSHQMISFAFVQGEELLSLSRERKQNPRHPASLDKVPRLKLLK